MLRRSGSVDDYAQQFMALSYRDTSLTEPLQVQLFITGLGDPLRTNITLQQLPPSMTLSFLLEPMNSATSLMTCHPQQRGRRRDLHTGPH
jgi:hypothetical protein